MIRRVIKYVTKSKFSMFVGWLETGFSTFSFSSTNQQTCCIDLDMSRSMQQVCDQVFDKKKSKAGRKRVANPHELVENLVANLVENQVCDLVCSWLE